MDYEQLDKKLNDFSRNIVTPNFLEWVDKWSRYKGETLYGCHVSIEDKGTFTKVTESPKMIWGKGGLSDFHFSETEKEKYKTIYDVSIVRSSSRCTDHNTIVIVSERNELKTKPRDLFIYSVAEYNKKSTRVQPLFRKLKKDIQTEAYKPYFSLLYNFCGVYSIRPYNDNTDRFFNYTAIFSDLEELNYEFPEIAKSIVVPKRKANKWVPYKKK